MEFLGSLHNHTDYNNLLIHDSICSIKSLIDYAIELGHKYLAITEHEFVGNAIEIEEEYEKVKDKIKIIRGNEIYLVRDGLTKENVRADEKYYHFILLAKNAKGHKQIRELSTRAWRRSFESNRMKRRPTYYQDLIEVIGGEQGNVIGCSACLGALVPTQLLKYKETKDEKLYKEIINWILTMNKLFGDGNFYLELQPSGSSEEQEYVNKELLKISKEYKIPYIISTDSHYINKEDSKIHEVFLRSQNGEREIASFYETTYLMNTEEIEDKMQYMTKEELEIAYKNIEKIGESCEDYTLKKPLRIPELKWKTPKISSIPKELIELIPNLAVFQNSDYKGDRILSLLVAERIMKDKTLQNKKTYDEVNDNLDSIKRSSEKNNAYWSAYLLNIQNIIDVCWRAGSIVLPARGSGGGFLLLYILDIIQINPMREKAKMFSWRFLNPDRVSLLDIDFDISGLRRKEVMEAFRKEYGEDRVSNVITFGKEKSKSAILTAARGIGLDVDYAQYISSLIPSDRGQIRTLSQCMYGDVEKGLKPVTQFVKEMKANEELWNVAKRIEGLISRYGQHAGGVIFLDEDFTNYTALMTADDGTILTQSELHSSEKMSLIKYDSLSVNAADRIQICIELLQKNGFIDEKLSLREAYEQTIGVYNLEREDINMWKMIWEHKIPSLFQMEQLSGIQGIALTKPQTVEELATLNSVIRLMAQEEGGETPLNKYTRFKNDITLWYKEMDSYGLTKEEQKILEGVVGQSYGICDTQELFMLLVQIPECGGFNLNFADRLRKSIAKKDGTAYEEIEKEYFETTEKKGLSKNLCNYVWNVLIATSRGYGFRFN